MTLLLAYTCLAAVIVTALTLRKSRISHAEGFAEGFECGRFFERHREAIHAALLKDAGRAVVEEAERITGGEG